jgi:hypothetical protein
MSAHGHALMVGSSNSHRRPEDAGAGTLSLGQDAMLLSRAAEPIFPNNRPGDNQNSPARSSPDGKLRAGFGG